MLVAYDDVPDTSRRHVPERGLLAGILERAYRDLFSQDYNEFKDAYNWFMSDVYEDNITGFTYKFCVDTLGLSSNQKIHIDTTLQKYRDYMNDRAKFYMDRQDSVKETEYLEAKSSIKHRRGYVVSAK